MKPQKIRWRCPKCGHKHRWKWRDEYEASLGGEIWMQCERCGAEEHGHLYQVGERKWTVTMDAPPGTQRASTASVEPGLPRPTNEGSSEMAKEKKIVRKVVTMEIDTTASNADLKAFYRDPANHAVTVSKVRQVQVNAVDAK